MRKYIVDPSEVAVRASRDPRTEIVDIDEAANITEEDVADLFAADDYESRIAPLLDRIPPIEADYIELSYVRGKSQRDIATIFGVTQQAVSYRLERAIDRIKYLLSIPQVTEEELRADLSEILPTEVPCTLCARPKKRKSKAPPALPAPGQVCRVCRDTRGYLIDVAIMTGMWRTTCQSAVAEDLNISQDRVRRRYDAAVAIIEQAAERDPKRLSYSRLFRVIRESPLVMYEMHSGPRISVEP